MNQNTHIEHAGLNLMSYLMIETMIDHFQTLKNPNVHSSVFAYFLAEFVHDYEYTSLEFALHNLMENMEVSNEWLKKLEDSNDGDIDRLSDDDKKGIVISTGAIVSGNIIIHETFELVGGSFF